MTELQTWTPEEITRRIDLCREEIIQLKRLLRAAVAMQKADAAYRERTGDVSND